MKFRNFIFLLVLIFSFNFIFSANNIFYGNIGGDDTYIYYDETNPNFALYRFNNEFEVDEPKYNHGKYPFSNIDPTSICDLTFNSNNILSASFLNNVKVKDIKNKILNDDTLNKNDKKQILQNNLWMRVLLNFLNENEEKTQLVYIDDGLSLKEIEKLNPFKRGEEVEVSYKIVETKCPNYNPETSFTLINLNLKKGFKIKTKDILNSQVKKVLDLKNIIHNIKK